MVKSFLPAVDFEKIKRDHGHDPLALRNACLRGVLRYSYSQGKWCVNPNVLHFKPGIPIDDNGVIQI